MIVRVHDRRIRRRLAAPAMVLALAGLGSASSTQTINAIAATGASTTVGILVAIGTLGGPAGAAIAGLIAVASLVASTFKGCGQTCVAATQIANQVEPYLRQNVNAYMGAPVHYASLQAAALNNFDTAWAALTQACGDPALQAAGERCISDRAQGSCQYKTDGQGGPNGSGNVCWNWFVGYRDPIANDPHVVPDPPAAGSPASILSAITDGSGSSGNWLLAAGLVLAGALL